MFACEFKRAKTTLSDDLLAHTCLKICGSGKALVVQISDRFDKDVRMFRCILCKRHHDISKSRTCQVLVGAAKSTCHPILKRSGLFCFRSLGNAAGVSTKFKCSHLKHPRTMFVFSSKFSRLQG